MRAETGPADKAYTNPLIGAQVTGGSTAVRGYWNIVRQAGAVARELMVQAAAKTWGVPAAECHTEAGSVVHDASGQRLRYGALEDVRCSRKADLIAVGHTADDQVEEVLLRRRPRHVQVDNALGLWLEVRRPRPRHRS